MPFDVSSLASLLEIATAVVGVWVGLWRVFRRLEKRLDLQDALSASAAATVAAIQDENARQYGGNGGGMREAINGLKAAQLEMTRRLDVHIQFNKDSER